MRGLARIYDVRMAQFVLKIEKLSHIMDPRASQDLRSSSLIMAPEHPHSPFQCWKIVKYKLVLDESVLSTLHRGGEGQNVYRIIFFLTLVTKVVVIGAKIIATSYTSERYYHVGCCYRMWSPVSVG